MCRRLAQLILIAILNLAAQEVYGQTDRNEGVLHTHDSIISDAFLIGLEEDSVVFSTAGDKAESGDADKDRNLTISLDRVIRFGCASRSLNQPAVCLVDDSWISGALQFRQGDKLRIGNDWLEVPDLDLRSVKSVVLEPPRTVLGWTELEQELDQVAGGEDQVWLQNGQRLSGIIRFDRPRQELDYFRRIKVDVKGREVELLLSEVKAIVFSPALRTKVVKPAVQLNLEDGTRLRLSSSKKSARQFQFSLPSGVEVTSFDEPSDFNSAVVGLVGSSQAGVDHLADLQVASYRYQDDGGLVWPLGENKDVRGRLLRTDRGVVREGIAMHASARAAYRLSKEHQRFLAEVRMAVPEANALNSLGSVQCSVLLVRERKLQTVAKFDLSREIGSSTVENLDIDVKGADLLVLLVEAGGLGSFADEVHWLDARLVKVNSN